MHRRTLPGTADAGDTDDIDLRQAKLAKRSVMASIASVIGCAP
jgi:hypothetical protein